MSRKNNKRPNPDHSFVNLPDKRKTYIPIIKLLFIEDGLEEKSAAVHLEHLINNLLGINCSFCVVPNAFMGLESCEHTDYDGIFICGHSLKHINAFDFLRIFRSVGGFAPIFIMSEHFDEIEIEEYFLNGSVVENFHHRDPPRFNGKIHKPFTKKEICSTIVHLYQSLQSKQLKLMEKEKVTVTSKLQTNLNAPKTPVQSRPLLGLINSLNSATSAFTETDIEDDEDRGQQYGVGMISSHPFHSSTGSTSFSFPPAQINNTASPYSTHTTAVNISNQPIILFPSNHQPNSSK